MIRHAVVPLQQEIAAQQREIATLKETVATPLESFVALQQKVTEIPAAPGCSDGGPPSKRARSE
jgi:hypothetical protein